MFFLSGVSNSTPLLKNHVARGPSSGLSTRLEFDLIAQAFEASDQALLHSLPLPLIEEGAPQVAIRHPVTQDMVDDHQDAVGYCHRRSLWSTPTGDAVILRR
jgi:hypothetical protein